MSGYDKIILPLERRFKNKIEKILKDQGKRIALAFSKYMKEKKEDNKITNEEAEKQANEIVDNIFKTDEGVQIIMSALLPFYINAGELAAQFFGQIHLTDEETGKLFSIIRDDYTQWLDEYGGNQIVRINETTKILTRDIIKQGLINGDSTQSIVTALTDSIAEYSVQRAKTIAETEMHNSFMKANFTSANKSGFKYKKWISAQDASVRNSHQALNGKVVKIAQDFKPGLGFPGDSRATAKETVRCRCVIRFMMKEDD